MSATSAIQAFIDATKKTLSSIATQITGLTSRLTKAEADIKMLIANTSSGALPTTITDALSHPPPTSGAQAYNSDIRPALGASYVDSVFSKTVRRITNTGANTGQDQNYTFHNINADATKAFHYFNGMNIIDVATGTILYTGQPTGVSISETRWDMLDADKYYYFSGTDLVRRNVAAQTNTTMKTFPATLQNQGATANYQTADGRYFSVSYSSATHIWDSQTNTIFSGSIANFVSNNGWVGITPSGKHLVTAAGTTATPQQQHYAYAVDLAAQSIGATPTQVWGLCGDHGALLSCSDSKDYAVFFDCYNQQALYRCDLNVDVAGLTPALQEAAQSQSLSVTSADAGHFSAVSVGTYQDWVFYSCESNDDAFDATPSPWRTYKQEIIAINVLTGARRRLAHHRSRGQPSVYYKQPRVSCSPKGDAVLWASNFNVSSPADYIDLYLIANPLSV